MAIQRILLRDRLGQLRQTVKAATHVRRSGGQPDTGRGGAVQGRQCRQADHGSDSITPTSSLSRSWSNPERTSNRRSPGRQISIAPTAATLAVFTSTNTGAGETFDFAAERNRRFHG